MSMATAMYPGFGKKPVNPLAAAMSALTPDAGLGPKVVPALGSMVNPNFVGAEADLIRQQADESQAAGSPINDWPRVDEHRQALADLYKAYHGGQTRGEVTQGVGVQSPGMAPQVGVRTLYRADPGTRQFAFGGGDQAAQIAAAQGAGGTVGNSPQLADMIAQQTAAQDSAAKTTQAQAEKLKAEALMGQTDYVRSGEAHKRELEMMALQQGQLGPAALEQLGIPQPGDILAKAIGLPEGDLSKAIAYARARGVTSAPPESMYGKAIAHAYGPQLQYIAQGQNPYKWGNPDLAETRAYLGMPALGAAQSPASIAAPEGSIPGANPGVLRNTAPRPGLRLGSTAQMYGLSPDTTIPSPDLTSTGQMLGIGAWGPAMREGWLNLTRPSKRKQLLATQQPALPRLR